MTESLKMQIEVRAQHLFPQDDQGCERKIAIENMLWVATQLLRSWLGFRLTMINSQRDGFMKELDNYAKELVVNKND